MTAGSTWHAAGLVTLYHPGINIKNLHWHSLNFYAQLEKETGQQIGFHQPGSLRLATNQVRLDEMKYQMSRAGWNKAPQKLVTPEECLELCPLIDLEAANVMGGLFSPCDGHIDPYSLTQAIAKGARKHGANLFQNAQVSKLELKENGSWDISTNEGILNADLVINAAGFWGKEVGHLAGLNLPLVPMQHQYLVTKTVPEVKALSREFPVLRHLEGSFYCRQERDGLLIGPYECEESNVACEDWVKNGVTKGFGKELFEPDLDRLSPHLEKAMELVPSFQNAEIQSVVNGPITYSPDILPMIGPSLKPNMWLAVGFAYGIVHAGGVGKYMADWILNGEPEYDLSELDPLRYNEKWCTTDYSLIKCQESYGFNNAVGYPHEERHGGRPTYRTSGIHQELISAGAFMGFHAGWEQPDWYSTDGTTPEYQPSFYRTNWFEAVQKEYQLVQNHVGIIDLTPFAKFKVTGIEARKYLDYLLAGSIPKPGRTTLAHALTESGKVYAEFTVTGLGNDGFMIVTGSGSELHDLRHMEQVARSGKFNDVSIQNVTDDLGVLSIAGPKSGAVLKDILDPNLVESWKFLDAKTISIGGIECLAVRISYTGELGWELYMPRDQMKPVYSALLEAGKSYNIGHFGTFTVNTFRIEKGFKMWGNEMNCDGTILEAGLEAFVRMKKKSDFIGKEALKRKLGEYRQQKLLMLEIDVDNVDPEGNESVWLCGKVGTTKLHFNN